MRGGGQFGNTRKREALFLHRALTAILGSAITVILALPSAAQWHGPPTTTTIDGHFLAPPPSVTSITGHYLPLPLPSVTSIPNYGYTNFGYTRWTPYSNGYYGRRRGYGSGSTGYSYAVPYYIPLDGYGYDYVGGPGPELYSGPPINASDPTLHIVAEQPPARYPRGDSDYAEAPPTQDQPMPQEQSAFREAKPNEPSVLVFRDGHQQEVSNYAIMGQTVYVFDRRTQKIALADLDVLATIRANDERGLEFKIPPQKAQKKADIELEVPAQPDTTSPANIASMAP